MWPGVSSRSHCSNNESVVQEVRALEEQAFTLPKFILKKVQELMRESIGGLTYNTVCVCTVTAYHVVTSYSDIIETLCTHVVTHCSDEVWVVSSVQLTRIKIMDQGQWRVTGTCNNTVMWLQLWTVRYMAPVVFDCVCMCAYHVSVCVCRVSMHVYTHACCFLSLLSIVFAHGGGIYVYGALIPHSDNQGRWMNTIGTNQKPDTILTVFSVVWPGTGFIGYNWILLPNEVLQMVTLPWGRGGVGIPRHMYIKYILHE